MQKFVIVTGNVMFSFEEIFATVDADEKLIRIFTSRDENVISIDMTYEQFTKFTNTIKKTMKNL